MAMNGTIRQSNGLIHRQLDGRPLGKDVVECGYGRVLVVKFGLRVATEVHGELV